MEWSDIRVFLAVVRGGTLGAAARELGQSQPTMGRRLAALEEAVGQKLFQRTNDGFVLTEEGSAVLLHAERLEQEALAFQRRLAGQGNLVEGPIRVTASDWFGAYMLAPIIAEYGAANPQVTVELLTSSRFYSLARREADLAFRIRPFDEPDIVSRAVLTMRYGAYVRKGTPHPVAGDGAGATIVTMNTAFASMPDVSWIRERLPNARVAYRSNNRDAQARLCAHGAGVAVLPIPLAAHYTELERIDLGDEPPTRTTWIGYHRDLRHLKRLRVLIDLIVARLAPASA
jgi:DNA-binding transcriptional LysR family regulator